MFGFLCLQNFLFCTKDETSPLKAIDFGLSDYARPGKRFQMCILLKLNTRPEPNIPI